MIYSGAIVHRAFSPFLRIGSIGYDILCHKTGKR